MIGDGFSHNVKECGGSHVIQTSCPAGSATRNDEGVGHSYNQEHLHVSES